MVLDLVSGGVKGFRSKVFLAHPPAVSGLWGRRKERKGKAEVKLFLTSTLT